MPWWRNSMNHLLFRDRNGDDWYLDRSGIWILESNTFTEPWRNIHWGNTGSDLKYLKSYKPETDEVQHLRILLHGPVGAGKSSFINSVSNVLQGRTTNLALANASNADKSFTKKFQTHKIRKGRGLRKTYYPFVFNDIMGLEDGEDNGVSAKDIKQAMKGHVKEGYKFNTRSPLSSGDPGYNSSPSANDKTHVLVCIFSANSPNINESVLSKMKSIRQTASKLGIPQLAVLTHIDNACEDIERDVKNVYKSRILEQQMRDFSTAVGIPMNCIFPVKNYSLEISLDDEMDALILSALRKMIDFGDDFLDKMYGERVTSHQEDSRRLETDASGPE